MFSKFISWMFFCRHVLRLRTFNFGLEGFSRLASRRYHVSKKEKKEKEKAGEKLEESREDEHFDFFDIFFLKFIQVDGPSLGGGWNSCGLDLLVLRISFGNSTLSRWEGWKACNNSD